MNGLLDPARRSLCWEQDTLGFPMQCTMNPKQPLEQYLHAFGEINEVSKDDDMKKRR